MENKQWKSILDINYDRTFKKRKDVMETLDGHVRNLRKYVSEETGERYSLRYGSKQKRNPNRLEVTLELKNRNAVQSVIPKDYTRIHVEYKYDEVNILISGIPTCSFEEKIAKEMIYLLKYHFEQLAKVDKRTPLYFIWINDGGVGSKDYKNQIIELSEHLDLFRVEDWTKCFYFYNKDYAICAYYFINDEQNLRLYHSFKQIKETFHSLKKHFPHLQIENEFFLNKSAVKISFLNHDYEVRVKLNDSNEFYYGIYRALKGDKKPVKPLSESGEYTEVNNLEEFFKEESSNLSLSTLIHVPKQNCVKFLKNTKTKLPENFEEEVMNAAIDIVGSSIESELLFSLMNEQLQNENSANELLNIGHVRLYRFLINNTYWFTYHSLTELSFHVSHTPEMPNEIERKLNSYWKEKMAKAKQLSI